MSINTLNHWKIVHGNAPDDGRYVASIEGEVLSTDARFPVSSIIRTSYLSSYEIREGSIIVVTIRGSEYLLGVPKPSEYLPPDFLKSFLPERKVAPAPEYDGVQSHIVGYTEADYTAAATDNTAPPPRIAQD